MHQAEGSLFDFLRCFNALRSALSARWTPGTTNADGRGAIAARLSRYLGRRRCASRYRLAAENTNLSHVEIAPITEAADAAIRFRATSFCPIGIESPPDRVKFAPRLLRKAYSAGGRRIGGSGRSRHLTYLNQSYVRESVLRT